MPLTIVIKILGATLTVFLVLAFVSLALTQRTMERIFKEDYATFRSVKVGMSEEQVRKHLGEPNKVFEKSTAPRNYYVQGYAHKERVIGNKVFIYIRNEPSAYIWFDNDNKVEDIFLGGS